MSQTSNIDQVAESLRMFLDAFNFQRPGKDQSLGRDIVTDVALGIQERSVQEKRGADADWAPNEPEYAEQKGKDYGVFDQPNVRTGQMLSLPSLKGADTRIEPDSIEMVYGTGQPPTGTGTGAPLKPADTKVTDRDKAGFAHDNARPFYEADQAIADRVRETCRENLNEYIRDVNAATGASS
jgi:hypothetical protein